MKKNIANQVKDFLPLYLWHIKDGIFHLLKLKLSGSINLSEWLNSPEINFVWKDIGSPVIDKSTCVLQHYKTTNYDERH